MRGEVRISFTTSGLNLFTPSVAKKFTSHILSSEIKHPVKKCVSNKVPIVTKLANHCICLANSRQVTSKREYLLKIF